MMWLEKLVAKIDQKIGNLEAWWTRATINQKAWVAFGVVLAAAVVVAAL